MFKSANSEHAVSGVTFQVVFSAPLPPDVVNLVQNNHRNFKSELPALNGGQTMSVEVTPQGPVIHHLPGVEFSFLRPDGTPAWSLRVSGSEIAVDCRRYTRWVAVSGQAYMLLARLCSLLVGAGFGDLQVSGLVLLVRDDFFWHADEQMYDLRALLQPSDILADFAFQSGPVWHSHVAWFEDRQAPVSTLVHLNVDGLTATPETAQRGAAAQVAITNFQNMRYRTPRQISWLGANYNEALVSGMENMHIRNKSLLKKLLTPAIASGIGLT
ncbi:MAG: TIGR04255 family protein [Devosia sp.]|uniref:TIGR04255 family protein n=1 Tax=Devosia sp. TaxID=1871048 RepID=UPI0024CCB0D0|nr:TIGR04255 family protein [Devosia sp.]UYN98337.1 MAG: TIGR04255 family protein [Devosia sp.]